MIGTFKNWVRLRLSSFWKWRAGAAGVSVDETVILNGRPNFQIMAGSRVHLADGVILNSYGRSNPLYCSQPVSLVTRGSAAVIKIGSRSGISGSSLCALNSITIGEDCLIGEGCRIFDNDFHALEDGQWRNSSPAEALPIQIGDRVFIGTRAIILKGVTIGDDSIVGAGSVVVKSVPPGSVVGGNPAHLIGQRK